MPQYKYDKKDLTTFLLKCDQASRYFDPFASIIPEHMGLHLAIKTRVWARIRSSPPLRIMVTSKFSPENVK